jgi:hypothetical protein
MRTNVLTEIGTVAGAIGKGLLAGLVGTAAITGSQMIEMAIEKREPSEAPAEVASKVFGVEPVNEKEKARLAQQVHWAYGTTWGAFRGILGAASIKGWPASAIHFVAIWGAAMVVQTKLGGAPPVQKWDAKTIVTGGIHHAVYAAATGLVYDAIDADDE